MSSLKVSQTGLKMKLLRPVALPAIHQFLAHEFLRNRFSMTNKRSNRFFLLLPFQALA
jgi:hypothetical protein